MCPCDKHSSLFRNDSERKKVLYHRSTGDMKQTKPLRGKRQKRERVFCQVGIVVIIADSGASTIKHYGLVIYGNLTDLVVS